MGMKEGLSLFIKVRTLSWNVYEYVYGRVSDFVEITPTLFVKDTVCQGKERNCCDMMMDKERKVRPAKKENSSYLNSVLMKILFFLELVAVVGLVSGKISNVIFGIPLMMMFHCFFLKNNNYVGNINSKKDFG